MTYRTNEQIENPSQEQQNLKHIREICEAKVSCNDDQNALQLARDVLGLLPRAEPELSPVQDRGETGI